MTLIAAIEIRYDPNATEWGTAWTFGTRLKVVVDQEKVLYRYACTPLSHIAVVFLRGVLP